MAVGYSGTPLAKKLGIEDGHEVVLREVFLPIGLVDNKVCAIDDTWSGLRVVWRTERRAALRAERAR
jgi:hypothetical protein